MIVPATRWHAFSNRAGEYGVTPTMALATCFSAVLARWGGLTRLLLNITLFDRQPLHPAVGAMLADFTNILLLDTACDGDTVSNWRVKTSSRLRRTGSIATGPASNYSVNSNASSATPTAPRWYLPAIWGVPLQQPRRIAVGRAGMGHLANAAGLDRSSGVRASRRGLATMGQQRRAVPPALVETLFDAYCQLINQLCDDESARQKAVRRYDARQPARDTRTGQRHRRPPFPKACCMKAFSVSLCNSRRRWR